jgi:hypothetical protein
MKYIIKQDDVDATKHLSGCETISDIKERLESVYDGEEWWVYEGGRHVRLHRFPRKGILAKLFGRGKQIDVFFAIEPES